jgi:septum site-determining protein MinC
MELAILSDTPKPRPRAGESAAAAPTSAEPVAESRPSAESRGGGGRTRGGGAAASGNGAGVERTAQGVSMLVDRPVRSGQRIYAAGGDLTVVAPVSSGAELMADGNIHIYAALRGRVIAGLKGDAKARIFCSDLQAELVSVAGHYRVSENIPAELKGRQVQVFLDSEVLRIEPL